MPTHYLAHWVVALLLTLAVEVPLVSAALRGDEPHGERRIRIVAIANLLSHAALFLGLPWLVVLKGWVLLAGEAAVAAFEAAVYRGTIARGSFRALAVSCAANAASFAAGALMNALVGWP